MTVFIRPARTLDFPVLQAIERDAFWSLLEVGATFGDPSAADLGTLAGWSVKGVLLVAEDEAGHVLGFGGAERADDTLHIAELDVVRSAQKRGIGRMLLAALIAEARRAGLARVTLTTDRLAPFNARFYQSNGFRILEADECGDRLAGIVAREVDLGLDPQRRVAMQLDL